MKKLISLILCIVMLLGLMPAMAFAAEEGGGEAQEPLPLYWSYNVPTQDQPDPMIYADPLTPRAAGNLGLVFWLDAEGNNQLPTNAVFKASANIGAVMYNPNIGRWSYLANAALPAAEGTITVEVEGITYCLEVNVGLADYGLYSVSEIDEDNPAANYIPKSQQNSSYSFSYTDESRSVYVIPSNGCSINAETVTVSDDLTYAYNVETGVLELTLKDGVTGVVNASFNFNGMYMPYSITFTPAPPELPEGYGQLYFANGTTVSLNPMAGTGNSFSKPYAGGKPLTASDFNFTVDSALGTTNVNGDVVWLYAHNAIPGSSGWIYAVSKNNPSVKYAIHVSLGKAFLGAYTSATIDETDLGKNFVPLLENKYTVNYVESGRSLYLFPSTWRLSESGISVDTEKVTATYENGVLKISLDENCTDARVTATVKFKIYNGQPTNSQEYTRTVFFTDGSEDMSLYYMGQTSITGYTGTTKRIWNFTLPNGSRPEGFTFRCDPNIGEAFWHSQFGLVVWDATGVESGQRGKIYAEKDGKIYSIDAAVEAPLCTVIYNDQVCEPEYFPAFSMTHYATPSTDSEIAFDVKFRDDVDASKLIDSLTDTSNASTIINKELLGNNTIRITCEKNGNSSEVMVNLLAVVDGKAIAYEWYLRTDTQTGAYGNNISTGISDCYVVAEQRTFAEEYAVEEDHVAGGEYSHLVPLKINGTTYYMYVGTPGVTYPVIHNGTEIAATLPSDVYTFAHCISFFVEVGNNEYQKVVAPAALAEIETAIGDTLRLRILPYDDAGDVTFAPSTFPALRYGTVMQKNGTPYAGHYKCQVVTLCEENLGSYLYEASCVLNGETIKCGMIETYAGGRNYKTLDYSNVSPNEVFSRIQTDIAALETEHDLVLIYLPAGKITGYLELPENVNIKGISLFGSYTSNKNGIEINTTINGGIINAMSYNCNSIYIHYLGAGKNASQWPEGTVNAGNKNQVYLPDTYGNIVNCIFEDYNIAVSSHGTIVFARNNEWINNGTAVRIDSEVENGQLSTFLNNSFKGNDVAIDFNKLPADYALTRFNLTNNAFIDNGTDIHNGIGRNIFMPGCYFGATNESGEVEARECVYSPKAVDNAKKQVLYYPQATDMTFSDYIYDTSFYNKTGSQNSNQNPVVSVEFTKTFPIPAGYLDGATFDVMKGDTMLAKIGFLPQARMMFRMRRAAESFDATIEVERSADGKTITVTTQPFPSGKTATISVPCDESWKQAKVTTESGEELDTTIADGYVSFVADAGGKFVLVETSSATPPVVPPAAPSVTPDSSETVTNPDGSTTTNVSTSDGSKGSTTVQPDGSVEAEVQLSGSAITNAAAKGECATLPIPEMTAGVDSESAPVITINTGVELPVRVEIPVREASIATVAVLVLPDGSEKIVKDCAPTEDGLELSVTDGAVIKVVDNATHFDDVHDVEHWGEDAINFASARELMQGVGGDSFSPDTTTTRGMVFTVLARYADHDTTTDAGVHWHVPGTDWAIANGVSDGSDPEDIVTREQIVTMLWRYAGSPAVSDSYDSFTDADEVSDWASAAVRWAVSIGLIRGRGENNIAPKDSATRAEFSQMLYKFCVR